MGLDSFNSSPSTKSKEPKEDNDDSDSNREKTTTEEITELVSNNELDQELLQKIRQEHMTDYYSGMSLESGWSYNKGAAIKCVCGDRLVVSMQEQEQCECGREYAYTPRDVVMTKTIDQ